MPIYSLHETKKAMPDDENPTPDPPDQIAELTGRPLSAEEKFYREAAFKEPVESSARIEETAKFLAGAVATSGGLLLAALKLSLSGPSKWNGLWLIPLALWWLSLLALILVLLPQKYTVGKNEPAAWRGAYLQARNRKYAWLLAGAILFIVGLAAAAIVLLFTP